VTQESLDFQGWTVQVRRSARARRIILKVDPIDGAVLVLPPKAPLATALDLLARNGPWLDQRMAARPQPKPFVPGAEIPLGGTPHRLVHTPQARRGVWLEEGIVNVSGAPDHFARRVGAFLKAEAGRRLKPLAFELSAHLGKTPARITIREVRSRWGSCSSRGDLSFSWRLVLAPDWIMRHVVAHEVAHLLHHDHSPRFWDQVQALDPNTPAAKRWLKTHGPSLFLYG
jgi:predicted metal-dependent hydrolase